MASIKDIVAEEFSPNETYEYGSFCVHNKQLLYHVNPAPTEGPFDEKDWKPKYVFDLLRGKYNLDNMNNLGPGYDPNETYNTEDVCEIDGLLKECLEDKVTGPYDPTKWKKTTLIEQRLKNSNLGGNEAILKGYEVDISIGNSYTIAEDGTYIINFRPKFNKGTSYLKINNEIIVNATNSAPVIKCLLIKLKSGDIVTFSASDTLQNMYYSSFTIIQIK